MKYHIYNSVSGLDMGVYDGDSPDDAKDALARDAGYDDYASACEVTGPDTLLVTPVGGDV